MMLSKINEEIRLVNKKEIEFIQKVTLLEQKLIEDGVCLSDKKIKEWTKFKLSLLKQ
jgi:hypothetical protein